MTQQRIRTEVGSIEEARATFRQIDRLLKELAAGSIQLARASAAHADTHIAKGLDEFDADKADIDWVPANYVRNLTPAQVDKLYHLVAHLRGIDDHVGDATLHFTEASIGYTPAVPDDWEDPDPTAPSGALDRIAGGHAGVVFVGPTAPTNPANGQLWLDTSTAGTGGIGVLAIATITASTTLTTSQTVILCDASGGAIVVTLPAAAANTGRRYFIKKVDSSANIVTVDGNANETIDGELTSELRSQYDTITIVSDGSNWHIL